MQFDFLPAEFNDPFLKSKITAINVYVSNENPHGVWFASGYLRFNNGNTSGQQYFDGKSFDEIILQMKVFLNNMR